MAADEIRPLPVNDFLIQDAVAERLKSLDYQRFAIVAHADQDIARMAVMVRLDKDWSFAGYLDKPYGGKLEFGAEIVFAR